MDPQSINLHANDWGGMDDAEVDSQHQPEIIRSHVKENERPMAIIDVEELVGRTYNLPDKDGKDSNATIIEAIRDHQDKAHNDSTHTKFRVYHNKADYEEILSYNDLVDHIQRIEDQDIFWELKQVVAHEGPLNKNHPNYKGSKYNVKVEWENGETTEELLSVIAVDAPVACAIYAKRKGLLNTEGWKCFKRIAARQGKHFLEVNKAKLRHYQ